MMVWYIFVLRMFKSMVEAFTSTYADLEAIGYKSKLHVFNNE